jgi:hypothetical protein
LSTKEKLDVIFQGEKKLNKNDNKGAINKHQVKNELPSKATITWGGSSRRVW